MISENVYLNSVRVQKSPDCVKHWSTLCDEKASKNCKVANHDQYTTNHREPAVNKKNHRLPESLRKRLSNCLRRRGGALACTSVLFFEWVEFHAIQQMPSENILIDRVKPNSN